eukprot:765322-Hanusia_phi.AAC.1
MYMTWRRRAVGSRNPKTSQLATSQPLFGRDFIQRLPHCQDPTVRHRTSPLHIVSFIPDQRRHQEHTGSQETTSLPGRWTSGYLEAKRSTDHL